MSSANEIRIERPSVDGPVTTGRGIMVAGTDFDLVAHGYTEAEYFLTGTAASFSRADDGVVSPAEIAEYRTRIVVYRPTDATRFNGTVVVEWLNVSGGLDAAADWIFLHRELMREGAAYVGVSAQAVGVIGGESLMGLAGMALVEADPERYGSLAHPGDQFSYDIFSQAGALVRAKGGTILDELAVERVLAIGESQSAFRLTTYVNDIDPIARVFDGYLVHARGASAPPLGIHEAAELLAGDVVLFRDVLRVPVLCFEAETDLMTLGYHAARQPDNEHFRLWEVAGLAHADVYTFVVGRIDSGTLPIDELADAWNPTDAPMGFELDHPVNVGPQRYVLSAAMRHLDRWVRTGTPPPAAPRLELTPGSEPSFVLDDHGIARGGVRTPHVDVPVAVLTGEGNGGALVSRLCGCTIPFAKDRLRRLYSTRDEYVARFAAATDAAVAAGFLLADDADEINAIAERNYPA